MYPSSKEFFVNTGQQVTDQTIKGAVIGVLTYVMATLNFDAGLQASLIPLLTAGLAYASTRVGDPGAASFLAKVAKEAPVVVEEATKKAAATKAPAKKKS